MMNISSSIGSDKWEVLSHEELANIVQEKQTIRTGRGA